ncbi:hypothetical protein [Nonomuraea basaltis]|uniref:hypothetical protein n=1 Tax=Nonomuraea basaltis TaxID=2495887 RepID=UPI001486C8EA|nr:hypothetical protein [Nonomuraea basaltis]
MRRILGAALIALPVVVFLASMAINKGWLYVVTMLAIASLSLGCVLGGMHLLAPKDNGR